MNRILLAAEYAAAAHGEQKRKNSGEPYIIHPLAVARMVAEAGGDENMVLAAILHDVLEDTDRSEADMRALFGEDVTQLVLECTEVSKPEDGNRAVRKFIDRRHFATASPRAQTIKLADLIHNSADIRAKDPGFAKVYFAEKRELLRSMTKGSPALFERAQKTVDDYFASVA